MENNLLEKASILLTPTAYNDGSMLSVKPENGDGELLELGGHLRRARGRYTRNF